MLVVCHLCVMCVSVVCQLCFIFVSVVCVSLVCQLCVACCGLEREPLDDARRSRVSSVEALPQCVCDQRVIANAIDFNCVFVLHVPCVPRGEARPGRQPARFPARAARGAFFDEPMTYLDR